MSHSMCITVMWIMDGGGSDGSFIINAGGRGGGWSPPASVVIAMRVDTVPNIASSPCHSNASSSASIASSG